MENGSRIHTHPASWCPGVSVVNPLGEKFDPMRDEAVESVVVEKEEDNHKILEVLSVGYKLQDKIIRAPKVKVAEYNG